MNWNKKINVSFHRINVAQEDYFVKFNENALKMIEQNNTKGVFDVDELKYQWELLEKIELNYPVYFFSLAKERISWPFLITENGDKTELSIPNASLADVYYGVVCPTYKFLVSFAASSGGAATSFKKLLAEFSNDGLVKLDPIYEDNIEDKVYLWDNFKKLSLAINMPSGDSVNEFVGTKTGEMVKIFDHLAGLKLTVSVSSGSGNEFLSSMMVKDILPELIANDFCTSLVVKGGDYENSSMEQYDLKSAVIKYSENVDIEGNYIDGSIAKQVLMRAISNKSSNLYKEIYFDKLS